MTKFNPKLFTGKRRIERAVRSNPGIYKIWIWNDNIKEYTPPVRGNAYVAARKRIDVSGPKEERKTFVSLDLARQWRISTSVAHENTPQPNQVSFGPSFKEVLEKYRRVYMPTLARSTQETYMQLIDRHFDFFFSYNMHEITPALLDQWILHMKSKPMKNIRLAFKEEFKVLSGVLKFYQDYDDKFILPMKPRHKRDLVVKKGSTKSKFITEEEFYKFRDSLMAGVDGEMFACLATVQFFQALRISEAAGLHWHNIIWNEKDPGKSCLAISASVFFSRKRGVDPSMQDTFKNAKSNDGVKYLPVLPEPYTLLRTRQAQASIHSGPIFHDKGNLLTYRQITHRYNLALKAAGLPYTATHIMRHGGGSYVYNNTNGDLSLVSMMLGNKDLKTAKIYAHRSPKALTDFVSKEWKSKTGDLHVSPQTGL